MKILEESCEKKERKKKGKKGIRKVGRHLHKKLLKRPLHLK